MTRPTPAMRRAMADAEVGDDVYGDDPGVNRLQQTAASMLGMEAALFLPSGTQSNLCALLAHCERGDEYIVGQHAHTYKYEGGGAAVLGSIQPQPLDFQADGSLDLDEVAAAIKPDDPHFAKTRLLCLENTVGGRVVAPEYFARARQFVDRHRLSLHLDGARIFNASVALGVPVTEFSRQVDSVSVCLSKGLGAPVGSVLCGGEAFIGRARRWRKMLGGGMRQAGILAAAGIIALTEQVDRLRTDHDNADRLAGALSGVAGLDVEEVHTNMVFVRVTGAPRQALVDALAGHRVRVASSGDRLRLVTHYDFHEDHIEPTVTAFELALRELGA